MRSLMPRKSHLGMGSQVPAWQYAILGIVLSIEGAPLIRGSALWRLFSL
jgi:hypothetical protein